MNDSTEFTFAATMITTIAFVLLLVGSEAQTTCQSLKVQATANEQSFDAPKIANCSWTVVGDAVNYIQIRLNQTAASVTRQCIGVSSTFIDPERIICSDQSPLSIKGDASTLSVRYISNQNDSVNSVSTFSVYFVLIKPFVVTCDSTPLSADVNEQSYNVYPQSGPIYPDYRCVRSIAAQVDYLIQVYLMVNLTTGGDQCVQVIDDVDPSQTSNVICAQSGSQMFRSTGPSVSVTYPGKKMHVYVDPFKVFYLSSPSIKCDTTQLTAALEEQYYEVYAENKNISSTFGCTRTVSNEQGGQMQIYLKLFNASSADQCVQVTDQLDSSQTAQVICAQPGQELYQSTGSVVKVTYPGKKTTAGIKSFQVFYLLLCDKTLLTAMENEQYYDVWTHSGTISTKYQCTRTITADAGETLQVYLKVLETSNADQCVQVTDALDSSQEAQVICAQSGQEFYQATGSSVSVTYPGKEMSTQVDSFQVYFMLTPTPPVVCDTTLLTADTNELYYDVCPQEGLIPTDFQCTRTIQADAGQTIQVFLKVLETSNADQCVQVTDALDSSQEAQVICAQSGQEFYQATGSSVSVTYPGKEMSTQVDSFQVYFMLSPTPPTVCDTTQLIAGANELYYDVSPQPGPIPTDFQCSRTIVADPGQAIQVYLKVLETSNSEQCVQVTDTVDSSQTTQVICAQSGQEFYKSTGSSVSVTYPGKEMSTQVDSFQVFYILATLVHGNCGTTSLKASISKDYFPVYTGSGPIPDAHNCSWFVSAETNRNIYISLLTNGTTEQCIGFGEIDVVICAQPLNNNFIFHGQSLTVIYPAIQSTTNVPNFMVFYSQGGTCHHTWKFVTICFLQAAVLYLI